MVWYKANADLQRDYYKRRKLAGRSPENDDKVSIYIEYCTGGLVRSENEARILYPVEKGLCFCNLKVDILKKFAAVHSAAKLLSLQHGPLHFRFVSYTYQRVGRLSM